MARRIPYVLTALLLASLPGFGQIIFGGPGVGYPGGGYPGGRRNPQGQGPNGPNGPNGADRDSGNSTLVGMLRKIEDKGIVIEDDDRTVTLVTVTGGTKWLTTSGSKTSSGDFQPGDRVSVATSQDRNKNLRATTVSMIHVGTSDEHSLASLHTDDTAPLPRPGNGSSSSSASSSAPPSGRSSNADKPVLRRSSGSDDNNTVASRSTSPPDDDDPDRPRLRRSSPSSSASSDDSVRSNSPSNSSPNSSSSSTPSRRRNVSAADDSGPRAEIAPGDSSSSSSRPSPPSSSDPDAPRLRRSSPPPSDSDSDAPRLRRSSPPPSDSDSGNAVASARPSLHADDVNGTTRLPADPTPGDVVDTDGGRRIARMPRSGDEVIDNAREAAFNFNETLPNYVVKQFTTRYQTVLSRAGKQQWQAIDTVTADVVEQDGAEQYKNILVNGKPPKEDVEKSGSWSKGEFSSLQLDILSPLSAADFHGKRSTTIVNRPAFRYDFSVEQPNSHWHVESDGHNYDPGYTGSIWLDKQTYRVLRIELQAQNLPRDFPLDQIESAVDYDFVLIGESKYLLPTHSEALSCARATGRTVSGCTRNVIEFRNYKKFTADTSISFDPDAK